MTVVLSLFDGISCGQVALNRAGIKPSVYFASEIEESAIQVTQTNFPNTIQLGDVRNVKGWHVGNVDFLIGGSPCQGFSFAGKQLNFEDERSKLFFEFVRLKNETKPKYFLLENVKMSKQSEDIITQYMGVKPIFIDSRNFSAQSRQRNYWTNIPVKSFGDKGIALSDILECGWAADKEKSYCIDANYGKGTNFKRYFHRGSRQIVFRKGRVPPKPPENLANFFQRLMPNDWRKLSVIECERLQNLPDGYVDKCAIKESDKYKGIGNGWTVDVIAHILEGAKK